MASRKLAEARVCARVACAFLHEFMKKPHRERERGPLAFFIDPAQSMCARTTAFPEVFMIRLEVRDLRLVSAIAEMGVRVKRHAVTQLRRRAIMRRFQSFSGRTVFASVPKSLKT